MTDLQLGYRCRLRMSCSHQIQPQPVYAMAGFFLIVLYASLKPTSRVTHNYNKLEKLSGGCSTQIVKLYDTTFVLSMASRAGEFSRTQ